MPCDLNRGFQVSRGAASILTGRPRSSAKVAATSSGVTRRGPYNSTTLRPFQIPWSTSAATRPTSAVATIGTGLSRGCKKLGITPVLARCSNANASQADELHVSYQVINERAIC